jgi:hypothetical protein
MTLPIIRIHNLETNEIIDRNMTKQEFEIYESNLQNAVKLKAESQAVANSKAALLDRLGITADEAKLLLS